MQLPIGHFDLHRSVAVGERRHLVDIRYASVLGVVRSRIGRAIRTAGSPVWRPDALRYGLAPRTRACQGYRRASRSRRNADRIGINVVYEIRINVDFQGTGRDSPVRA